MQIQNRFLKIRNILVAVLALNWAVAGAKLIYGFVTRCTAMSADGFHSFSDGTSNIIGLVGIWIASQPVDKDHPYGHKKYETFASIVISILLFIISFNLIRGGISRLFHPVLPSVTPISFVVMLFTITVNTGVFFYERARSRSLKSDILAADARHTQSDILVSISVIFTLLAIKAGFPMIDTIVSMAIALFIAYVAFNILRESSDVLCDRATGEADEIKKVISDIKDVKNCHKVRTRGRPDDIHVDLHIFVDSGMSVGKAHELNHTIQRIIRGKIRGITDIAIHIEPYHNKR